MVLAATGFVLKDSLNRMPLWTPLKLQMHKMLQDLAPRPLIPKHTALVLIGDQEFWCGELAARNPLKRDYLASVIEGVAAARPAAIALDHIIDSPAPDGSVVDFAEYAPETGALFSTLRRVCIDTDVVLARTFRRTGHRTYLANASPLDDLRPLPRRLRMGHINLPWDQRTIPSTVVLADGRTWPAFFEAVVLAANYDLDEAVLNEEFSFGTFIPRKEFRTLSAGRVRLGEFDFAQLRNKIVFIGGTWSADGFGLGPTVDLHDTPLGPVPGVYLHATYVEALLQDRTKRPVPHALGTIYEVVLTVFVAILSALEFGLLARTLQVVLLTALTFAVSYFAWQNVGLFFDAFLPIALVIAHSGVETFRDLRREATLYRAQQAP